MYHIAITTTNRKVRGLPRSLMNGALGRAAQAATRPAASKNRKKRRKQLPERIRRRMAFEEIRRLVSGCGSSDPRRPMTSLARALSAGMKAAEITKPGGPLDAVIDAAENCEGAAERAIAAEAAVWALAWAARSKKSSVASGAALQRIVGIANAMLPAVVAGDTTSTGFLLVLGRLFADVEACERFVPLAVTAIEEEIAGVMPSGGPIARTGAESILRTVGHWAGLQLRAETTGDVPWDAKTREGLLSAIDTAARLLPVNHRRMRRGNAAPRWAAILEVASRHGVNPALSQYGHGLAVIRSGWSRRDTRILVDARGPAMHLEIVVGSRPLCCGEWTFEASADGVPLEPTGGWADSCFESDKSSESDGEAIFAEWTLPLSRGLRLERQLVFAPRDRVLLFADAIVPSDESRRAAPADAAGLRMEIEYRGGLPVHHGIEFESADDTRELIGFDESVRLLAMPLAMPEWSSAPFAGRFEAEPGRVVMMRRSQVARMYAPVWFDLEPSRIGERLTWRRLTVADSRQNLPEHRACGYRVQVGGSQWLVYRGLDAVRNRSVLGCNLACEFLLGRIGRSGVVERLIEIQ